MQSYLLPVNAMMMHWIWDNCSSAICSKCEANMISTVHLLYFWYYCKWTNLTYSHIFPKQEPAQTRCKSILLHNWYPCYKFKHLYALTHALLPKQTRSFSLNFICRERTNLRESSFHICYTHKCDHLQSVCTDIKFAPFFSNFHALF